ncbi:MAG: transposase [Deltaproteobacteria bacterium]|nr:transposase [Deltaproteobacteria bacterium]
MKKRLTEQQIVGILHQLDASATAKELGRRHGVHPNTIAAWKAKYHGMEASDVVHMRQLADENTRQSGEGLAGRRSEPAQRMSWARCPRSTAQYHTIRSEPKRADRTTQAPGWRGIGARARQNGGVQTVAIAS